MFNKGRWIAAFLSISIITSMAPAAVLSAQEVTAEQEPAQEAAADSSVEENNEESVSNDEGSEAVTPAPEEETEENAGNSLENDEKNEDKTEETVEENSEKGASGEEVTDSAASEEEETSEQEAGQEEEQTPGQDVTQEAAPAPEQEATTEAKQEKTPEAQNVEMTKTVPGYTAEPSPNVGSSDELFEAYANRLFYGERPKLRGSKNTGDRLTGQNRIIYEKVKEVAARVAAGDLASTRVTISFEELGLHPDGVYSAEDLGLSYIYDFTTGTWNSELGGALQNLFSFDLQLVQNSLYADCPYELYWGSVFSIDGYSYSSDGTSVWFEDTDRTVSVSVQPSYRDSSDPEGFTADLDKTRAATNAASYSSTILQGADAFSTDYEKLCYFRDEICGLVEYNHDAAGNSENYPDRDPWALIYVFDRDPDTNVVCEGYAEAFQYLCSQADFIDDSVCAYSVTGTMHLEGEDGENHKWNIVHMDDGRNYIADITNSDEGSWGQGGELFFTGASGSVDEGYKFPDSDDTELMCYEYDEETLSLFSTAELTLNMKNRNAIKREFIRQCLAEKSVNFAKGLQGILEIFVSDQFPQVKETITKELDDKYAKQRDNLKKKIEDLKKDVSKIRESEEKMKQEKEPPAEEAPAEQETVPAETTTETQEQTGAVVIDDTKVAEVNHVDATEEAPAEEQPAEAPADEKPVETPTEVPAEEPAPAEDEKPAKEKKKEKKNKKGGKK